MTHSTAGTVRIGYEDTTEEEERRSRPNLLYIHSDQHNPAVLGCYGDRLVKTPNLDRLASRGVLCTNVYCPSPVCVASRMSMLTGRYPHEIGVWTNDQILDSATPTLAHAMGAAGYRPALAGRMHANGADQLHGYAERPIGDHGSNWPGSGNAPSKQRDSIETAGPGQSAYQVHDEDVTAEAIRFINAAGEQRRSDHSPNPFSLSVGFMLPHSPYLARQPLYDEYYESILPPVIHDPFDESLHPFLRWWREHSDWVDLPEDAVRRARAAYWTLVADMDTLIGRILQALEENGLDENTLIIYTSNHGDHLGEHDLFMKRTFYEESVKVPAIVSWPGVLPQGERCDRVLSSLDLNATMLDAMRAPELPGSQGRSALKLLRNPAVGNWEDLAFSEYAMHEGVVQRMVRMDQWKLIYHHEQPLQLFDVNDDPHEQSDRAGDPSCHTVMRALTDLVLDGWDPRAVVTGLRESRRQMNIIREWCTRTNPPDQYVWERRPEMQWRDP